MSKQKTKIFIISGPSRVGKDVITKGLLKEQGLNLEKVLTATSRPKRDGEIEGRDYYFFSPEEFEVKIQQGYFLEWAVLSGGRYYGTPISEFDRIQEKNKNAIMKIDVQGASQVAKIRDDIVRIFIKPDSKEHIIKRMKQAGFTADQVQARLKDMERELQEAKNYDYVIVNKQGEIQNTIKKVSNIIKKEIRS